MLDATSVLRDTSATPTTPEARADAASATATLTLTRWEAVTSVRASVCAAASTQRAGAVRDARWASTATPRCRTAKVRPPHINYLSYFINQELIASNGDPPWPSGYNAGCSIRLIPISRLAWSDY